MAESNIDSLVKEEFFSQKDDGVAFEIGAASPEFLSIGKTFREAGWRVICVEPNPIFAQLHRDKGHEIYEYACANIDNDDVDFTVVNFDGIEYEGGNITMESFSSISIRNEYEELLKQIQNNISDQTLNASIKKSNIKVKVRTAKSILEEASDINAIDIVAIDTEGWELECLQGYPFDRWPPQVFIIENLFPTDNSVERFLKYRGYKIWRRLAPNDVYILNNY